MNDNLMKKLKCIEEACTVKVGKHLLWLFVWSTVNIFLSFQPDSVLKTVVYFVTAIGIYWQLLMIGYCYGQLEITDTIHKAEKNSCKSELTNGGDKDEK